MQKRAVIVTGKFVQDHEFIYPYYRLQEEGYAVDVAVRNKETVQGQIGVKIVPTKDFSDLKVEDYDLVVIPGGAKCQEYMRQDKEILTFLQSFHSAGRVISTICHGSQMLISAKLVKGRKISGYYSIRDDIENAGATYVDQPAVNCDRLITTAHYKDMGPWMKETIAEVDRNTRSYQQ